MRTPCPRVTVPLVVLLTCCPGYRIKISEQIGSPWNIRTLQPCLFLCFTFVTWRIIIYHYNEFIMGAMTSQITSLTIVYSTVYSGADQIKHQSSASPAFVRGIHRGTGEFPAQIASNAESVSIWWRHHAIRCFATVRCGWPIPGGSLCSHWLYLDTSSLWKGAPKPTSIFSLVS